MSADDDQREQIRQAITGGQFVVCDNTGQPPPYVYVDVRGRALFVHQCTDGEYAYRLDDRWVVDETGPEGDAVMVAPSLRCTTCGLHGSYRDGWVPA